MSSNSTTKPDEAQQMVLTSALKMPKTERDATRTVLDRRALGPVADERPARR
jgi:hypothetical protein